MIVSGAKPYLSARSPESAWFLSKLRLKGSEVSFSRGPLKHAYLVAQSQIPRLERIANGSV
jgi:hypothetical protein